MRLIMQTEERIRIVKAYYNPELSPVACVAKCAAGLVIVTLIAVIGAMTPGEEGGDKLAYNAHVKSIQP